MNIPGEPADQLTHLLEDEQQALDERKGEPWRWVALVLALGFIVLCMVDIAGKWMLLRNGYIQQDAYLTRACYQLIILNGSRALACIIVLPWIWQRNPVGWLLLTSFLLLVAGGVYTIVLQFGVIRSPSYYAVSTYLVVSWCLQLAGCVLLFLKPMRAAFSVQPVHIYLAIGIMLADLFIPRLLTALAHFG